MRLRRDPADSAGSFAHPIRIALCIYRLYRTLAVRSGSTIPFTARNGGSVIHLLSFLTYENLAGRQVSGGPQRPMSNGDVLTTPAGPARSEEHTSELQS